MLSVPAAQVRAITDVVLTIHKRTSVLTALFKAPPPFRVLRVAVNNLPANLTRNWLAEVEKWLPLSNCLFVTLGCRTDMEQFVHSNPVVLVSVRDWSPGIPTVPR